MPFSPTTYPTPSPAPLCWADTEHPSSTQLASCSSASFAWRHTNTAEQSERDGKRERERDSQRKRESREIEGARDRECKREGKSKERETARESQRQQERE